MKKSFNVSVRPKPNEPIDKTIKRFTKKVKKSGVIDEFRENRYHKKDSVVRREKEAVGKWREKQLAKAQKLKDK